MLNVLLLIFGLVALIFSAEVLVRGVSGLARSFRIPSLVAGATIVAFAASAPQFTVAVQSAMSGKTELAMSAVVGSNIFSVLVVLALAASLAPLVASQLFVRVEVPALIAASLLAILLASDGVLGMLDAIVLVAALGALVLLLVIYSLHDMEDVEEEPPYDGPDRRGRVWRKYGRAHRIFYDLCLVVFGVVLVIQGAGWLIDAATALGNQHGLTETTTGLTIVAAGTALPAAFPAIIATMRGEPEIAVGAVLGACAFNILGVFGFIAFLQPGGLAISAPLVGFDMPVMLAAAIACLPLVFTGNRIEPWYGAILFAVYVGYVSYLVMNGPAHEDVANWRTALVAFVLPLTVLAFAVVVWRKLWAITEAEA